LSKPSKPAIQITAMDDDVILHNLHVTDPGKSF
jgi:hypothetical protein